MSFVPIPGLTRGAVEPVPHMIVPTMKLSQQNLTSRAVHLGFVSEKEISQNRPGKMGNVLDYNTARKVLNCRTDLTHKVLRAPILETTLVPPSGMGRNQSRSLSQLDAPAPLPILPRAPINDFRGVSKF